jgi:arylsulfatase A-like enzyme
MSAIGRRPFLKALGGAVAGLSVSRATAAGHHTSAAVSKPNVLFIAFDDMNHWMEPLRGHPQAKTPHLQRFAGTGVNFTHSYCASPSCLPSRTALLTGVLPHRSGVYTNYQYWREAMPDAETLPAYFKSHGYWAGGAGKIFHNDQPDPRSWDEYFPSKEKHMPQDVRPPVARGKTVKMPPFPDMYMAFDWSPLDVNDDQMGDAQSVKWVIDQLNQPRDRPFFLGCGIYRPHLPWYVPLKYFEMFPLSGVRLPPVLSNDLADVGERAVEIAHRGGNYHQHLVKAGLWKNAVQAYLASLAFADAQFGRLMAALDASDHRSDTIVVVWSDHGWQFGEKEHWRKFALWENVAHVVTMLRVRESDAIKSCRSWTSSRRCANSVACRLRETSTAQAWCRSSKDPRHTVSTPH